MKIKSVISTLLLFLLSACSIQKQGQKPAIRAYQFDINPCPDGDCGTNGGVANPLPSQPIPPESLHLIPWLTQSNLSVTVTNGRLDSDYVIEKSTDLLSWTNATGRFEVASNSTATFYFDTTQEKEFYRLRDDTLIAYANPANISGNYCGHDYVMGVNYYSLFGGDWGYPWETNMIRHIAMDGTGNTNNTVVYLGRFGDTGCDLGFVNVTPIPSPSYRFTILFPVVVSANPYPIKLKGFRE